MQNYPKQVRSNRSRLRVGAGMAPMIAMLAAPQSAQSAGLLNLCLGIGSDCSTSSGSYTLSTPAGVAIGGGQITGLGNGLTANAGEINSIAIGNGASTAATALTSVAIGTGASATGLNSVAIGAGSLTTRANEFSVGSALVNRQVTNVAAGTAATDAVNLSQLNAVNLATTTNASNIASLQTTVTGNSTDILGLKATALANTSAVNAAVQTVSTLTGSVASLSTTVGNTSTALGTLTTQVTKNTGDIATSAANIATNTANIAANTTGLTTLGTRVDGLTTTVNNAATTVAGLGTQVTQNTAAIATNTTNIATNATGLTTLGTRVDGLTATVNNSATTIAGLGTQVTQNTAAIATNTTNIAANATGLTTLGTRVDGLTTTVNNAASSVATLGTQVTQNTADIASHAANLTTLNSAVSGLNTAVATNGSQIAQLGNTVATNTASLIDANAHISDLGASLGTLSATVNTNGQNIASLTTQTTANTAGIAVNVAKIADVQAGVTQNTAAITVNANAIQDLSTQVASGQLGPLRFSTPGAPLTPVSGTTNDVTLVGKVDGDAVGLHNVANGTIAAGSTDAVNGGQVFTLGQSLNALSDLAVSYDDGSHGSITLGGVGATSPVTLTNIGAGRLAADSTAAVNGAQLFATNTQVDTNSQNIAQNITDIGNLRTSLGAATDQLTQQGGQLLTLGGKVDQNTAAISTTAASLASLTGVVQKNGNDITDLGAKVTAQDGRIQANVDAIGLNADAILQLHQLSATGAIGPVRYSNAGSPTTPNGGIVSNDVTIVGATPGTPVGVHNVANGEVSATSTDAINGSQLYAFESQIGSLDGLALTYDDSSKSHITLGGVGATSTVSLTNLADGNVAAGSKDAVNGGQLFQTNSNVAGVSDRVDALNTTVTNNYSTLNQSISTVSGNLSSLAQAAITYDDPSRASVTLNKGGASVALTNVADGTVAAGSTDAVTGNQLFQTNASVSGISSRVDALNTAVTNNYSILNNAITNDYNTLSQSIADLAGTVGAPEAWPVQYANAATPTVPNGNHKTNDLTLVGALQAPVGLHNVANGEVSATSTDAVNGSQLFAINANVTNVSNQATTNSQNIGNLQTDYSNLTSNVTNGAIGPVQYSSTTDITAPNGGTQTDDLTLVGIGGDPVALHNVAAGIIGAGSTDAINGSQLNTLGVAVATTLGGFTYNPATNSFTGSFTYDGVQYGSVQSVFDAIGSGNSSGGTSTGGLPPGTSIRTATQSKYFHANSTLADSNATGLNSTAIGPDSQSSGVNAVAMGNAAAASGDNSVAIGYGATAQDGKAVSIGTGNIASGDGAVSIGDPNVATGAGATALGKDNTATGTGTIAIGNVNVANQDGAAAIGNMNHADGRGAISLGISNSATGLGAIAIGSSNQVSGDGSLAIGSGITSTATDTLAIGTSADATAVSAVAVGNRATASGADSLTVGTDALASGQQSSSFGENSAATADFTTAIGGQARATTIYSTSVGQMSTASGLASLALGNSATASGYASAAVGTGSVADQDGSVALGVATRTVRGAVSNYSAFGLSAGQTSQGEVAIARNISYTDPNTGQATVTGDRQITGLAAGSAETDAVNVSQLKGVSSALGTAIAGGLGGGAGYNAATGTLTGPSYNLFGTSYNNVGDALQALASYDVANGGSGSGGIINPNIVTYADSSHNTINLAGNGTAIHNVADGAVAAGSTDAVNGSQLAATNAQVAANTTAIDTLSTQVQNGAVGVVQYSNAATPTKANGGTKTNDVTLVGADAAAPVAIHNVAAGQVAAGSTDAVNGGQLAATNAQVATAQTTANTALAMGQNSVQYDSGGASVTLGGGGDSSTPVAVHNVAAGTSGTDAVNLSQLVSATNAAVSQSAAYTDQQIAAVRFDLGKVRKDAAAGTAGAMAMAGMPQPYEAGRGMIAMGAATYQGQTAFAIGLAKALSDEHTVVKAGMTYDSRHNVGLSGGIGYQF